MTVLLVVLGVMAAWGLLTFPMAVAVGRAFRAGGEDPSFESGERAALDGGTRRRTAGRGRHWSHLSQLIG